MAGEVGVLFMMWCFWGPHLLLGFIMFVLRPLFMRAYIPIAFGEGVVDGFLDFTSCHSITN